MSVSLVDVNNIITLTYETREGGPGGTLVERMDTHYPFHFLFGKGQLLPAFEAKINGLQEGDRFDFTLTPQDAYGFRTDEHIIAVPMHVFTQSHERLDREFREGMFLALTDEQGVTHNGQLRSWNDQQANIDFNHALAGKVLHFAGTVLRIRPATVDELVRGAYIASNGIRR